MFFKEESMDERIQNADKELDKLDKIMQEMEEASKELMEEFGTSEKETLAFIGNKENFSDEEWKKIQDDKKNFLEELEKEISNIDHPHRKKQAFEELKNIRNGLRI